MKFLDQTKIHVKAGRGGHGCTAFRREKFVEFGGPDGGNGGKGGDILVVAVSCLNTLADFHYRQHFQAEDGQDGMGANQFGRSGDNIILSVPVGTQILNEDQTKMLADLTYPGQSILVVKGGSGGFGNAHYKSATERAPYYANSGQLGAECWIWLKLKLIANVGLVGLPNAGKSTFLATSTHAHPKIANYMFTTLYPYLGVAYMKDKELTIADIPGIVEDAYHGTGLGVHFLGHVERCSVLLHLIDSAVEVAKAYYTIRKELYSYSRDLVGKPEILALNKIDSLSSDSAIKKRVDLAIAAGLSPESVFLISSRNGYGLEVVLQTIKRTLLEIQ